MISGNERLIVVLGMAHSGTTILTYVLKQHPDVLLAVDGSEAWILENTWLPLEEARPIQDTLETFPNKRLLLKRPWASCHHAEFMAREMPNAKFVYCYRDFAEISKSWSKPTSFVDNELRSGGITFQLQTYQNCWERSQEFGRTVTHFRQVHHPEFVQNPRRTMGELAVWLGLRPFGFDVSQVSHSKDIKRLLCH